MPPPTPSTAPARSTFGSCPGVGGSKSVQKTIKKHNHMLGSMFDPLWEPYFGSRRRLQRMFSQTFFVIKEKQVRQPPVFQCCCPETAQRSPQDAPKTVLKSFFFNTQVLSFV